MKILILAIACVVLFLLTYEHNTEYMKREASCYLPCTALGVR